MDISERRKQVERTRKPPKRKRSYPAIHPDEIGHISDILQLDPACPNEKLREMGERFARTFK